MRLVFILNDIHVKLSAMTNYDISNYCYGGGELIVYVSEHCMLVPIM